MPFSYRILPEDRLAYVTASGPVDLRATLETMGRVAKDPRFEPDYRVVVDAREMQYTPSFGELRVLAWALGHERQAYKNRVAVVRPASAVQAREDVYTRLSKLTGVALGLFRDRDAALAWVRGS